MGRLGTPPGFDQPDVATLTEVVRRTAAVAWSLAAQLDRDDPLLAALRERGSATAGELGEALLGEARDTPAVEVRAGLNALIEEGLVHRTGHAKATRYNA